MKILAAFAFLLFMTGTSQAQYLPHDHYKYQTLWQVFESIAAARGDVRQMPLLEINARHSHQQLIAQFKPLPRPTVVIDEKLYDLCAGMGADSLHAMACILGHELAHYYENHAWTNSFADLINSSLRSSSVSEPEKQTMEAEADYYGTFYGFLAGYETFRLLPAVLRAIYQSYQLPAQLQGYPDQQERLLISRQKMEELQPLLYAFQAGQLLFLRKDYDHAAVCLDYVLSRFPGREVYNNAGVVKLAQALSLMDIQEVYFAYPFELEAHTRLRTGGQRNSGNQEMQQSRIKTLLGEAQKYFEQVISLDRSYSSGYINLACSYSLQGNQAAAVGVINQLESLVSDRLSVMPANAHLLRGIALVKNGQTAQAFPDFEQALTNNAFQAAYNYSLFQEINTHWSVTVRDWLFYWPELERWIHNFWNQQLQQPASVAKDSEKEPVIALATSAEKDSFVLTIADHTHPVSINVLEKEGSSIFTLELSDYTIRAVWHSAGFTGSTSRGVTIEDSLSKLQQLYGKSSYSLAATDERQFVCYENEHLIFEVQDEKVRSWWLYQVTY